MKNLFKIIAVLSLFSTNIFEAQQVVKKDTLEGTPLAIMMDEKVSSLLIDIEDKCATKLADLPETLIMNMATTPQKQQLPEFLSLKKNLAMLKSAEKIQE